MKYATWTKRQMVEALQARGYGKVGTRLSKALLNALLVADDDGKVNERYW